MDKGASKSNQSSKQSMASMQQKVAPSGGVAQAPNYNPSGVGWAQPMQNPSMGMQNPGMGMQNPRIGMQNPGMGMQNTGMGMQNPGMGMQNTGMGMQNSAMGYGMMPMYGQYGMMGTNMNPGMQFQKP